MKERDVALSPIPQSEGILKNRPVLLLSQLPPFNHFLAFDISSQTQQYIKDFDELITIDDKDFKQSGLLSDSIVRLFFLAVIPKKRILGSIGFIPKQRLKILQARLSNYLVKNQ